MLCTLKELDEKKLLTRTLLFLITGPNTLSREPIKQLNYFPTWLRYWSSNKLVETRTDTVNSVFLFHMQYVVFPVKGTQKLMYTIFFFKTSGDLPV